MSKFYSEISKYYDYIFPTGDGQLNLIKEVAGKPPKNILDIACGSGGYSKHLSDAGYNVTAIDLDETMVEKLRGKDRNIQVHVMDMLDIHKLNNNYDLLFSIGNSIVHLENNKEILEFLYKCRGILKPGGHIIIQTVNYDRVLIKDIKNLPTIENKEVDLIFQRHYDYLPEEHKIDFKTILQVGGETLENSVLLHPITSKELTESLIAAGFKNIQLYGSFKKDEYNPLSSFPLVIAAQN